MSSKPELVRENEIEAMSHSIGEIALALHGENFPVIAYNLRTTNSGIDGIHVERGGRPSNVVVLHEWGESPDKPDFRLIITGGEMGDLRNLSIQSPNPEQVGGEDYILIEGPSINIDDYAAESGLSSFRKLLKRLSGEVMLQDFVGSIGRTVLSNNEQYSDNPLTREKLAAITSVITKPKT